MVRRSFKEPENSLLPTIKKMKQQAFMSLMEPAKNKMYRLALRLLVSKEAAEDAIQEVMLKLWSKKDKMSSYDNVEAFAMTVTKNHCLDQLKSKQNSNLRIVHSNYDDGNLAPDRQMEIDDELSQVRKIIAALPEQQRTIVQLREIEQYEYEEIAEMLEMNPTAIRVALSRARKTIREEMIKKHRYGIK